MNIHSSAPVPLYHACNYADIAPNAKTRVLRNCTALWRQATIQEGLPARTLDSKKIKTAKDMTSDFLLHECTQNAHPLVCVEWSLHEQLVCLYLLCTMTSKPA